MNSLYFATSKSGYICKPLQGKLNINHSQELPIYRKVNEFMNYKPSENAEVIKQPKQQIQTIDIQKNLTLPTIRPQNKNLNALVNLTHTYSSACGENPNEEDLAYSQCKQRDLSCRETSASQIGQINGSKMKISMIERNSIAEAIFDRSMLQQEIEKEKILRKNLENSYNSLLQKINWEKQAKFEQFEPSSPCEPTKKKKNRRQPVIQASQTNSPKQICNAKLNDLKERQQTINPFDSVQNHYIQHLNDQRLFQTNLIEELQQTKERLAQIEEILKEQQCKKELDQLHRTLENKNIDILRLKGQISSKGQFFEYSVEGLRKHIPFIAIFFMMFLIIAMVAKGQRC